jgi:hypothetical protein
MRASSFGKKCSVLPVRFPDHGGLMLAAPAERDRLSVNYGSPSTARHRSHGGMTPAALDCCLRWVWTEQMVRWELLRWFFVKEKG